MKRFILLFSAGLLIAAPIERFEKRLPEFKRLLREATSLVSGITQGPALESSTAPQSRPAARRRGRRVATAGN